MNTRCGRGAFGFGGGVGRGGGAGAGGVGGVGAPPGKIPQITPVSCRRFLVSLYLRWQFLFNSLTLYAHAKQPFVEQQVAEQAEADFSSVHLNALSGQLVL